MMKSQVTKTVFYTAECPFLGRFLAKIEYGSSGWACLTAERPFCGQIEEVVIVRKNYDLRPSVAKDRLSQETGLQWSQL